MDIHLNMHFYDNMTCIIALFTVFIDLKALGFVKIIEVTKACKSNHKNGCVKIYAFKN